MNPIIILPIGLGVAYWWTKRRRKASTEPQAPATEDLPPEGRGPFDGPGGLEPPKPEPEPTPEPTPEGLFPGPHPPHDPAGEYGPVPVTIWPNATIDTLNEWPRNELHVFISTDCTVVLMGSGWLEAVFLPAAVELATSSPDKFHSVAAITWEVLIAPFEGRPGLNPAADCLTKIPDFTYSRRTEHGTFSQYAEDYEAYIAAWESFERDYADLAGFYMQLAGVLATHPDIQPILDTAWNDGPEEG